MSTPLHSDSLVATVSRSRALVRAYDEIDNLVTRAALALNCRVPRVSIKSMRNACYNPITHRISVSSKLVRELPEDLLAILIAHETCHASQRNEILADALLIQSWPLVVLMLTGMATIGSMLADALYPAVAVGVFGIAITYVTARISSKRWEAAYLRREILADAFANKHCGNERGSAELLVRCTTLEDEGRMTTEARARIAALPT